MAIQPNAQPLSKAMQRLNDPSVAVVQDIQQRNRDELQRKMKSITDAMLKEYQESTEKLNLSFQTKESTYKQLAERFEEISKTTLKKYDATALEKRNIDKAIAQFYETCRLIPLGPTMQSIYDTSKKFIQSKKQLSRLELQREIESSTEAMQKKQTFRWKSTNSHLNN